MDEVDENVILIGRRLWVRVEFLKGKSKLMPKSFGGWIDASDSSPFK